MCKYNILSQIDVKEINHKNQCVLTDTKDLLKRKEIKEAIKSVFWGFRGTTRRCEKYNCFYFFFMTSLNIISISQWAETAHSRCSRLLYLYCWHCALISLWVCVHHNILTNSLFNWVMFNLGIIKQDVFICWSR